MAIPSPAAGGVKQSRIVEPDETYPSFEETSIAMSGGASQAPPIESTKQPSPMTDQIQGLKTLCPQASFPYYRSPCILAVYSTLILSLNRNSKNL